MIEHAIRCPVCSHSFALTETLREQMKESVRAEFEILEKKRLAELSMQQQKIDHDREVMRQEKEALQKQIDEKIKIEKERLWVVAQEKAREKIESELKDLKEQNAQREKRLKEAEQYELILRNKARELEDQAKRSDIELARRLDEERKKLEEKYRIEQANQFEERVRMMQEDFRKREMEKDKQLDMMKRTLDDAQRKSEQASMQIQGEVQEADLKQLLTHAFPMDTIADVPPGIHGADVVQTVRNSFGQVVGCVVWESKNTKQWSDEWVKKLKTDQALVHGDVSVLVSRALPDDIRYFGFREGVWVVDYAVIVPVVSMIRAHLMQSVQAKNALLGREEKKDFLYDYLSSAQFRNRIENIVIGFKSLKEDLETEKRSMQRIWSKREKEIERIVYSTTNFYGDVQGIIGAALPALPSLTLEVSDAND